MKISNNRKYIATINNSVKIWDANNCNHVVSFSRNYFTDIFTYAGFSMPAHREHINDLQFSQDSLLVATRASHEIIVWGLKKGTPIYTVKSDGENPLNNTLSISTDSRILAVANKAPNTIEFHDISKERISHTINIKDIGYEKIDSIAFSDNKYLLVNGKTKYKPKTTMYDVEGNKIVAVFEHSADINSLSQNRKYIGVRAKDSIQIWALSPEYTLHRSIPKLKRKEMKSPKGLYASDDGRHIVVFSYDSEVVLLDGLTGKSKSLGSYNPNVYGFDGGFIDKRTVLFVHSSYVPGKAYKGRTDVFLLNLEL
ncbi:WD40 repeat domain-containing protein [Candidatus Thiosymbion oneisti]|uniref:WD40 repeat domain-containing protein n=1 Tax=Candidatus Thiosymbion oneisti TaxID=589554 RepID=UPI00105FECE5|nr:hypothetical protein [Candidatus Thiosymbion oneisti]